MTILWSITHYQVLGVTPDADARTLRLAYLKAVQARPQTRRGRAVAWLRGRSAAAQDLAYQVLSNTVWRAEYDHQLRLSLWLVHFPPGH